MPARCVKLKHSLCDWSLFRVKFYGVFQDVVAVTKRRATWIDSLFGLFPHSLLHFLAQILNIVSSDHNLDTVNKFCLRFRILADDLAFFWQVDFYVQIFQSHAVTEVPIQAVRFFDDEHTTNGVLRKENQHLPKLFSPGDLRSLDINKFAHDCEFVSLRIFPKELQLCRNLIALTFLILAGHPNVNHSLSNH